MIIEAAFELSGIIRTLLPFPVTVTVAGDLKDILPVFMSMSSCTRHPDSYKSDNKARSLMPLGVLGLGCFNNSVIASTLR